MPTTPESLVDDVEAETDEQVFLECAERFKLAESAESANRALALEDLEFRDGQQWPDDLYNMRKVQRRVTLVVNHTDTLVRRIVNNMREQRPRIKVHPVGDGADIETARVVSGLIRHIENLSNASVAYDTAGESAVDIGWGYARIVGEYIDENSFEQELKIKPIFNTLTCYIDPNAMLPDGSDMDWFIISDKMKRTEFKRRYPQEELEDWSYGAAGDNQREWLSKYDIRIAEYYRIKHKKDVLYRLSNGKTCLGSEWRRNGGAFELAGITRQTNPDGSFVSRGTERRQVQWFRLNGTKVVEKRDLRGHYIPVARCQGNVLNINGEVRRKGAIRNLKDPARQFNYWESAKTEKLALSSKAPWVGVEGQFDGHPEWDDANQKPYSVLKYKLILDAAGQVIEVPPPQRQAAVEVEAGFSEAASGAIKNLMMVAGMPHEPGQDTPGTVVSGVALRRRQAISDISHFQYYDNQTLFIRHLGSIALEQIPFYYSTERMQRIMGEDGVPQMVGLNQPVPDPSTGIIEIKNNMQVGRYDVVMDTGPGYETRRQEGAEAMIDLMKTPIAEPIVKTGADIVVRNMDFPGADDLADRLMPLNQQGLQKAVEGLPKQAQGIVTALMGQNQQLQQTVQQLQLEVKYGITKAHLAATTKAHDTEMRTQTTREDVATRAQTELEKAHIDRQTKLDVAEISAAGKLLDTHVHGRQEESAREHELKVAKAAEKTNGAGNG
jgi:hypothetical protein